MPIYRCDCTQNSQGSKQGAQFQDRTLGPGMRIYTDGGPLGNKQRCTVCSKVKSKG